MANYPGSGEGFSDKNSYAVEFEYSLYDNSFSGGEFFYGELLNDVFVISNENKCNEMAMEANGRIVTIGAEAETVGIRSYPDYPRNEDDE